MKASCAVNVVLGGAAAVFFVLSYRAFRLLVELRRHAGDGRAQAEVALLAAALALAGLSLVATARLRTALRVNVALAVASATLVLYLFEAWHAFDDPIARQLTEKHALIESLNRQGKGAYGGVEPARFTRWRENPGPSSVTAEGRALLPLAGISRKLTVDCKEGEDQPWLTYVTDEHGFNNPPGLWAEAPVELAAVGDSFTVGSCVHPAQNMVGRLRQRFPTALNLGMAGSGPLIMLAELREYGPLARPRIVLWCHYGGNDLRDLRQEQGHPILERYLEDGFRQGLAKYQAAVDAALREYYDSWLSKREATLASHTVKFSDWLVLRATRARLGLGFSDPFTFAPTPAEFQLFETILEAARRSVRGWDGRLHFVYLPAWVGPPRQIGARAVAGLETATRKRVLAIAARVGVPVIDVTADFAEHADPASLFACPGCHYSASGYRLAAERVLAELAGIAASGPAADPPALSGRSPESAPGPPGSGGSR